MTPIRASLQSLDELTQAMQGNCLYAAGQQSARSTLLKDAAANGKVKIRTSSFDIGNGVVSLI